MNTMQEALLKAGKVTEEQIKVTNKKLEEAQSKDQKNK